MIGGAHCPDRTFFHDAANDPDQNNQVGDQRNNPATIGPNQGTLNNPRGVTLTSGGQLIVSDTANSRVLVYAASAGVDGTDTDLCN